MPRLWNGCCAGTPDMLTHCEERTAANAVFSIPTLKEYFLDLEYILGVISDGPAKSFAYRRIKYLESRWQLYCLLNEYQELAEMKRVPHR